MRHCVNELGQPVGPLVDGWREPAVPQRAPIAGRYCTLVPLCEAAHSAQLYAAYCEDARGANWTYLPYGPFSDVTRFSAWVAAMSQADDPLLFAVIDAASRRATGVASLMRINPAMGCIEIGHIHFSPRLQGSVAATEALFLLLRTVFALGYRRCEWKCDALNEASRRAARRLGFCHEGVFRQAGVVKGRNRDTAWFSMLDHEWPAMAEAYAAWLAPSNFSATGVQQSRLSDLTAQASGVQGRAAAPGNGV